MDATNRTAPAGSVAPGIERLTDDECWARLEAGGIARLVVRDGYDLDLFPVDFAVLRGRIVVRTTPGAMPSALHGRPRVALEADGERDGELWSVILKADARTPELDGELQEIQGLRMRPAGAQARSTYLMLEPASVSGRRFADAAEAVED